MNEIIQVENVSIVIDSDGQVTDYSGCTYEGRTITTQHGEVDASVVIALAFSKSTLPVKYWGKVRIKYFDGDENNLTPINLGYQYDEIESEEYPGFYHIPYYNNYLITKCGKVFSLIRNRLLSFYRAKPRKEKNVRNGYLLSRLLTNFGKSLVVARHRLLGLAFKYDPRDVRQLDINHLDGDGSNNDLDNIEWASRGQNLKHAYETGLRTQNKPVLVKSNDGITRYSSAMDAAKGLGYTRESTILYRIKNNHQSYRDGLIMKFDDGTDWPETRHRLKIPGAGRAVSAECSKTGRVYIFETIAAAGRYTGLNQATIALRCNSYTDKLLGDYKFKYLDDFSDNINKCPV